MRQTLFYWPHETFGIPWFGIFSIGSLILLVVIIIQLTMARTKPDRDKLIQSNGMTWFLVFLAISFLLPRIEFQLDDTPVGLPIRGYGVLLMLGVVAASWVALRRCESRGISRDAFFSLATWTVVAGVIGARLFYVIQKWDELPGTTLRDKLWVVLQVTEGGLVVYGSVIGGLIVIALWTRKYRVPVLLVADAVTPAFFLGVMLGRIGCFLNGCCYGGICEMPLPAVRFPSGSVVYMEQLESGRMIGMVARNQSIDRVIPESWAASHGIRPHQTLESIKTRAIEGPTPAAPFAPPRFDALCIVDGKQNYIEPDVLPARSLPVHPSQIYASIGGLVLFLWTMSLSQYLTKTGQIFGCGLVGYGFVRILEELIRVDEAGQFGTSLSIATWISLVGIVGGAALLVYKGLAVSKPLVPPLEVDVDHNPTRKRGNSQ
jgi:phosphatidylglycerol---prolipoprotein diacylglyceryl transferase